MSSKDVASAQGFANSDALSRALGGDTNQISSIFYRAGLNPDGTPSAFTSTSGGQDPQAEAIYRAYAQKLIDAGINPGQGTAWKGHSHNFFHEAGNTLGSIAKIAAPIAAMAIPGLGPLAAAGLAFGGNELGNVLTGHNAMKSLPGALESGAAAGGGRFLMGKLGSMLGGGGAGGDMSNVTSFDANGNPIPATDMGGSGGLGSKLLGGIGDFFKDKNGNIDFGKILGLGGTAAGLIGQIGQQHANERLMNQYLNMAQGAYNTSAQDYANKAPLRNAAFAKLGSMVNAGPTDIFNQYLHPQGASTPSMPSLPSPGMGSGTGTGPQPGPNGPTGSGGAPISVPNPAGKLPQMTKPSLYGSLGQM